MDYQQRYNREVAARNAAKGLGWFSIGLGAAEVLFAGPISRWLGMRGQAGVIRLYGIREIATGLGIFSTRDKAPWMWGRVAGDAIDMATLAANLDGNPRKANVALAMGAVAGATALDVVTAQRLGAVQEASRPPVRDYSDRSGFPMGLEAARGAAARDFEMPADMRVPQPLRPQQLH